MTSSKEDKEEMIRAARLARQEPEKEDFWNQVAEYFEKHQPKVEARQIKEAK